MPSFSKLLAWSALMTIAFGVAVQDSNHLNDLEGRDLHITITADVATVSSDCSIQDCWNQCESEGAIGGVCEGPHGCQCAYSGSKIHVQKDGARVRLAANECNLEVCNDVCYQKGGFAGGVCTPDGSCECVDPDKDAVQHKEPSFDTASCFYPPLSFVPVCSGGCSAWSDCPICVFYERCCHYGVCKCGTSDKICT